MGAVLEVLAALLRSHGAHLGRHAKGIAFWAALLAAAGMLAAIFAVILGTHLLALWLGTTWALASILGAALLLSAVAALMLVRERRRLVQAHREHVEQERLALRAGVAEIAGGSRVAGSLAAVSAAVAGLLLVLLRRFGGEPARPDGAGPPEA